jgi:hypothetical protein
MPSRAILAVLAAATLILITAAQASAQEQRRSRNLFEFLFGDRQRSEPARKQPPVTRSRSAPRSSPADRPSQPPQPEVTTVEKSEAARVVLVVGDFMGSGLADALDDVFADNPDIRIVDGTNGSSGFVRNDVYDWPENIGGLIEGEKPAALVVMIGSNDRQQIRVDDGNLALLSEPWSKEYKARATKFAKAIHDHAIPYIWVGQPAFKYKSMLSDMLVFNDVYKNVAADTGGTFVDIWDGFVDENGAFIYNGPDVNGQPVQLRGSDGINLTSAGKAKVAFYAEKPLKKLLGITGAGGGMVPGIAALPNVGVPTGPSARIDRTPPMSLNDLPADGGELLGQTMHVKSEARTPAEKLTIEGLAPEPEPGRADDFIGRKPEPKSAGASRPETTTEIAK